MKTYAVCDQDGFVSLTVEGDIAHYANNPTHTSHIGVGGDSCSPAPYEAGSSSIPQVTSDPPSPVVGVPWILATGTVGSAGLAMGVMGLTYTQREVTRYDLSIKTEEGYIKRVRLI